MSDAIERFSTRVQDYVKYRPSYPKALFDALEKECGLAPASVIADVGSGTGIATEPLLERGHRVFAVEPNAAMRRHAEHTLGPQGGFTSVDGRAEATGLADGSVDLVLVAQALHWFDRAAARREFSRILRPGGFVALAWNDRSTNASAFLAAYEGLLRTLSVDYAGVSHADVTSGAAIAEFFAPARYRELDFPNAQDFDRDGLIGRARSSSYVPGPDHPSHAGFLAELSSLFDRYAVAGSVRFEYTARLFLGRLE